MKEILIAYTILFIMAFLILQGIFRLIDKVCTYIDNKLLLRRIRKNLLIDLEYYKKLKQEQDLKNNVLEVMRGITFQ